MAGLGDATFASTEMYLHASPAEMLETVKSAALPSIRPEIFPGVSDSLVQLLNGK